MSIVKIMGRFTDKAIHEIEIGSYYENKSAGFRLGVAVKIYAEKRRAESKQIILERAILDRASLDRASLVGAILDGAILDRASLDYFKNDLVAKLLIVPDEMEGLRQTLIDGKIDGSAYQGECACFCGTISKLRGTKQGDKIEVGSLEIKPNSGSPVEQFFMMIKEGQTPENHQPAKIALSWIDEAIAIRDAIRTTAKVT